MRLKAEAFQIRWIVEAAIRRLWPTSASSNASRPAASPPASDGRSPRPCRRRSGAARPDGARHRDRRGDANRRRHLPTVSGAAPMRRLMSLFSAPPPPEGRCAPAAPILGGLSTRRQALQLPPLDLRQSNPTALLPIANLYPNPAENRTYFSIRTLSSIGRSD